MKTKTIFSLIGCCLAVVVVLVMLRQRQPDTGNTQKPVAQTASATPPTAKTGSLPAPIQLRSTSAADDKQDELSSSVQAIVDEAEEYASRLSATSLTNGLNKLDREALYSFLVQRSPLDGEQRGHVLKNRLLNTLTDMDPPPAGLSEVLVRMYRDHGEDVVIRDYALQHMASNYEQLDRAGGVEAQDRQNGQQQIQSALWEAARETDSSLAGTALLGLSHLAAEGFKDIQPAQVADAAFKLAGDMSAGEMSRITALQVCANLGNQKILPVALQTAREGETVHLKISAIGALGILAAGNTEAKGFLEQLQRSEEPRLRQPAQLALKRILAAEQVAKRKS